MLTPLMCVRTGCMAALQAEHFLQVHGAADLDAGKVPAERGAAMALENGTAKPRVNVTVREIVVPLVIGVLPSL